MLQDVTIVTTSWFRCPFFPTPSALFVSHWDSHVRGQLAVFREATGVPWRCDQQWGGMSSFLGHKKWVCLSVSKYSLITSFIIYIIVIWYELLQFWDYRTVISFFLPRGRVRLGVESFGVWPSLGNEDDVQYEDLVQRIKKEADVETWRSKQSW